MVLLPLREAADAWELVRGQEAAASNLGQVIDPSSSSSSPGPVLIFAAAADPDALAAVRTLTALLKADLVRYEVHPVTGYVQLRSKFDALVRGPAAVEPRAVLCVNCGAMVNLVTILALNGDTPQDANQFDQHQLPSTIVEPSDLRIFVMDSHRPFHLANLKSRNIIIFDDTDDFNEANLPLYINWEDEWGNVIEEEFSDDDDSEDDSDDYSEDESDYSVDDDLPENNDNNDPNDDEIQPNTSSSIVQQSSIQDDEDVDDIDEIKLNAAPEATASSADEKQNDSESMRKRTRNSDGSQAAKASGGGSEDIEGSQSNEANGDEDSDSDSEEEEMRIRKRGRIRPPISKEKKEKKRRRKRRRPEPATDPEMQEKQRLRDYYAAATLATSSACVSHSIAAVMRRSNLDTLWMAIVGITSQYVNSCIPDDMYDDGVQFCRSQISVVSPDASAAKDANTSEVRNVGYVPSSNTSDVQRIGESVELRLDLLRHWSLHDSLMNSSYTATRLTTWRQTGKRRLFELLATLGIPLKESRQRWCYMNHKNKVALDKQLGRVITRFDLGEGIQYDSFVRSIPGHRGDASAADVVHAITALLEYDDPSNRTRNSTITTTLERFWRAYDALDSKRSGLLELGIDAAISVQQLTATIGGDVIERRKYVPSGPFRYVFLRDQQYKEFISYPLLLRRLALFLNTALIRQGAREKPFIILAPDVGRGVWIAVATTTSNQRNDFGHRFRKAATKNGSRVTYDGFDSSVCEIEDGQEIEFVRFLHDVMR